MVNKEAEVAQMLRDAEMATKAKEEEIQSKPPEIEEYNKGFASQLKTKNAGKSPIYDTKDGKMSWSMDNMLPHQLKKLHKDGTLRFTVYDPHIAQVRGQYKCMLHKDGLDREFYDTLYLPICNKDNITSPYQVQRHMQKRHKMELASIVSEREKKDKAEDRQLQRDMIVALTGKASSTNPSDRLDAMTDPLMGKAIVEEVIEKATAPLYVSDKKPRKKKK